MRGSVQFDHKKAFKRYTAQECEVHPGGGKPHIPLFLTVSSHRRVYFTYLSRLK